MQNMPIGIFRGDDTDAFSYQTIVGTINTDLDLTGCKAVFRYLGFSVEFDPIPEDRKLTIVIPADETKKFPPGLGYASLRVYDSEGRLKTFSNRIMVFVATKTPMFGSDEFEVDFNVRASLEPLKFFVGPNPDDFDEYRGYVEKVIDRASATKYGLAILLDAIDSDLGANDGVAATPVAVKAAYAAIIDKLTDDYYTAEQTDEAIDRVAAYYITYDAAGNPFPIYAALSNATTVYSGGEVRVPTRNDYAVVLADETHDGAEYRYIYAVAEGQTTGSWQPQFPVEGVMTVDQTVTRNSTNPVSGGGVWSAIWGALSALPTGFTSLYDWVVAQLGLKRDYTDLSYDTTETVEVPALHSVMTVGGQTLAEYDLLCTEEVPDPPQIGHTYTWRADGAAFYVTQGVSALQTTWILYSQNDESLGGVTTQNATQGFYPDVEFRPSNAVITIHKTTAQKTVTIEDELALKSDIPAPSTATPAMDGTGAAGTSAAFARGDHVHPTDTSRVPTSRKVNGKALSSDVTLTGADIPLNPSVGAPNLNSVVNTLSTWIGEHVNNTTIHVTAAEKSTWNGKQNALSQTQLDNIAAVPNKADSDGPTITSGMTVEGSIYADRVYARDNQFQACYGPMAIELPSGGVVVLPTVAQSESGTLALAAPNPTAGNLAALDANGNPTDAGWTAGDLARYALVAKTISNGAVTLDDRAINTVAVSSSLASLTVNFPTATSGKARDFGLRLTVASGITTAPQIVLPQGVVCENADGEAPEIGADGAATILYFTETASGVFLVKGEMLQTITQA